MKKWGNKPRCYAMIEKKYVNRVYKKLLAKNTPEKLVYEILEGILKEKPFTAKKIRQQ